MAIALLVPAAARAMHEADHRFSVEGHVCDSSGQPVKDLTVHVKDSRVDVRASAVTNDQGYYKATLHLHDDNRGDPIVVIAKDEEKKTKADFNANDKETERHVTVNFGTGCEAADHGTQPWVYYTAGIGIAMVAAFAGVRLLKGKRKQQKRGKKQRKTTAS